MSFSKELLDKYAPEANCIQAMKIWKLPDGKESLFPVVCNGGEYFAELKKDGYWYQYEKTEHYDYLFSRNISANTGILTEKLANVPHIHEALKDLPSGTILIGEIYYPGKTSKDVTKIMGCLAPEAIKRQQSSGLIHYYLHDVIKYNGINIQNEGAWTRYQVLKAIWDKFNLSQYSYMELADAVLDNIQEFTAAALTAGEEGAVLKKKDAPYVPDKRPAWSSIKIKKMDYVDCICIGFEDATKYYDGKEIQSWQYWEVKEPSFYDCFEEDHCFAGWINPQLLSGNYYYKYTQNCNNTNCRSQLINDDERYYMPVTKGYYYGWKTSMKLGAYDDKGNLIEIGTVSSGLTDELKEAFAKEPEKYLNRVVAIQCMQRNNEEHTLRHGFFKSFRDDKNSKDCTIKDIFN